MTVQARVFIDESTGSPNGRSSWRSCAQAPTSPVPLKTRVRLAVMLSSAARPVSLSAARSGAPVGVGSGGVDHQVHLLGLGAFDAAEGLGGADLVVAVFGKAVDGVDGDARAGGDGAADDFAVGVERDGGACLHAFHAELHAFIAGEVGDAVAVGVAGIAATPQGRLAGSIGDDDRGLEHRDGHDVEGADVADADGQ